MRTSQPLVDRQLSDANPALIEKNKQGAGLLENISEEIEGFEILRS